MCAKKVSSGDVYCWGDNDFGQLARGTSTNFENPDSGIKSLENVDQFTIGSANICYTTINQNGVKCIGLNNFGQLGDGTELNNSNPVSVFGITTFESIHAGQLHTCAILDNTLNSEVVKCWGYNNKGQLGDASTIYRDSPTTVQGL